jgi:O-phosphoseryl-tRNA synthetase
LDNKNGSAKREEVAAGDAPVKKKVKVKAKPIEKPKTKKKKTVTVAAEKPIDERVLDVSFDEDIPHTEAIKVEPLEERVERFNYLTGKGTQHPVQELIQNLRNILINSGFNEVENSFFVAETDIFKQFKIKSSLFFNRVFYLAENQHQMLGLTQEQISQIQNIKPHQIINIEKLKEIFSEYNEKKIENNQLFDMIMSDLNLNQKEINKMLEIIPQLKNINPKLTNITLRSTMAPSWMTTLAAIMDKESLPLKIFSTGVWFKRESKLNELNLRSHYGASCIIMDNKISIDNGKVITTEILNRLGFKDIEFKEVSNGQNFNFQSKELEIFSGEIKIASCGVFSRNILRKYGIDRPVLFINFGMEHMVMVQKGIDDIRELMYPQFYKAWKLNDDEIAQAIEFIKEPKTKLGQEISTNLVRICTESCNTSSPCEFTIWEGIITPKVGTSPNRTTTTDSSTATVPTATTSIGVEPVTSIQKEQKIMPRQVSGANNLQDDPIKNNKKRLIVKIVKHDKDSKLCGPATFNEIVIKNGDIFGVQNLDQNPEMAGAQRTQITYLDAFSKLVGSNIESLILENDFEEKTAISEQTEIEKGIIKDMEDINLQLDGRAFRYILTNNKKIDVRGPMFLNVEYELLDPFKKKVEKATEIENEKSKKIKVGNGIKKVESERIKPVAMNGIKEPKKVKKVVRLVASNGLEN